MGAGIKAMRLSLGMTQDELARSISTHRSDISRLESGRFGGMTIARLLLIVDALASKAGVSVATLFEQRRTPSLSLFAPGAFKLESSPFTRKRK
jgi:transcriptional regulator with XRE-family HTH domain